MWMQDPGSPSPERPFLRHQDASGAGKTSRALKPHPEGKEGLGSELGWNLVQFLFHEFRMVLGRTFKGHSAQLPAIIRDAFTTSACSEPHPALSTFFLVMKKFSLFPLPIQVSIHISLTPRAALPHHEESQLEPQHLPPHLVGFSLSQHSGSSRKSTGQGGSSRADRIPLEMQGQALILRLHGAWLCQGAASQQDPFFSPTAPFSSLRDGGKKQKTPLISTFQRKQKPSHDRGAAQKGFTSKIWE